MASPPIDDRSDSDAGCNAERELARRDGVSHTANLPFLIGPEDAETAALLVHGFTATPWEMRLVGETLARQGICCMAVRLPGHGTSPKDLATRSWQEWLDTVDRGYRQLATRHANLFGVGMSTGCLVLLAQALATRFDGLVLCSPYLEIKHRLASLAGWIRLVRPYHVKIVDQTSEYYYHRRPVAGVHQINKLIKDLRPRLDEYRAPVLAFNAEGDETVVIESGRELVERLGSRVKIHQVYGSDVGHVLTREENPHSVQMFALIGEFIKEMVAPGKVRRPSADRGR